MVEAEESSDTVETANVMFNTVNQPQISQVHPIQARRFRPIRSAFGVPFVKEKQDFERRLREKELLLSEGKLELEERKLRLEEEKYSRSPY